MIVRVLLTFLLMAPAAAATESPKAAPDDKAIAAWIDELDNDSFQVRDKATRALIGAGSAAVEPLSKAAASQSLEASVRAIAVLDALYAGTDDVAVTKAELALEALVQSPNRSIAARSDSVLMKYDELRQKRALAEIARLGGLIDYSNDRTPDPFGRRLPSRGHLECVVLDRNWKGGDEGLKLFKRLVNKNDLRLYVIAGTPVSQKAIENLTAAMPDLRVQTRGESLLGIGPNEERNPLGCLVMTVKEGTAADKAGCRTGDIITHFAGKPVEDFNALISLIALTKPGDNVKMDVLRDGRTITLNVVMQGWRPGTR